MPFLSPNQQCPSTEGNQPLTHTYNMYNVSLLTNNTAEHSGQDGQQQEEEVVVIGK